MIDHGDYSLRAMRPPMHGWAPAPMRIPQTSSRPSTANTRPGTAKSNFTGSRPGTAHSARLVVPGKNVAAERVSDLVLIPTPNCSTREAVSAKDDACAYHLFGQVSSLLPHHTPSVTLARRAVGH